MPYLARRFTVIAPDLIGHGESAKPQGRLLARGAREHRARPARRPRPRARHVRRALPRRWHRDAALLPVPRALRAARAGRQRRPRARRQPAAARRDAARLGARAAAARRHAAARARAARRGTARPRRPARWDRHRGDGPRTRDAVGPRRPAPRSCTPCARSSSRRTARSTPRTGCISPRTSPSCSCGASATRSSPSPTARATHAQVPGSRLELFAESGHFPQLDEPERFIDVLVDFIESTEPADPRRPSGLARASWRSRRLAR